MSDLDMEVISFLNKCSLPFNDFKQLDGMLIFRDRLLDKETYNKVKPEIKELKKIFCSSKLTCLQETAEAQQKWPLLNLVRQILKACSYKMDPIRKSDGYTKDGRKKYKRYFIIKQLKEVEEKEMKIELIEHLDRILFMTVTPGASGRSFQYDVIEKIKNFVKNNQDFLNSKKDFQIGVDGGISKETANIAVKAGADVLISGSSIFWHEHKSISECISEIIESISDF